MSTLGDIGTAFSLWIDTVARGLGAMLERFKSRQQVQLVQDEDGFAVRLTEQGRRKSSRKGKTKTRIGSKAAALPPHRVRIADGTVSDPLPPEWAAAFRGSRAELVLQPSGFLFRPLELPKRAGEFLEGIIRAQIDRLTPWNASDAVYHWTRPSEEANERIVLTIVATARSLVAPLVRAVADLGATTVVVSTVAPGAEATPVTVLEQRARGAVELGRIRAALLAVFVLTGLAATASMVASGFVADYYDEQRQQIQHRIAERRAALRAGQEGDSSTALLAKRKHTTPSSVMVIEELSALLPDHTYATELRIEGDKLQVVGITHDAPSLIQILEQSPHFTRATFFAPTTRAANDPGERFHIEAHIRPHFGIGT
jgi:general secretion pathway protein L